MPSSPSITQNWWQTHQPAKVIDKARGYFSIPAVGNVTSAYQVELNQNVPTILLQWNFKANRNFTLKYPISIPDFTVPIPPFLGSSTLNLPYVMCVRYIKNNVIYRYKLWTTTGDSRIFAPLYTGQPILKNFCIELWSVTVNYNAQGDDSGGDNIIAPATQYDGLSFYYPTIPALDARSLTYPWFYYYDPKDDGATYVLLNNNVVVPNGTMFQARVNDGVDPTVGTVLSGVNGDPVTAILKYVPNYRVYLADITTFVCSHLNVKATLDAADTFASADPSEAIDPFTYYSDPVSFNLDNYPALGDGAGSFPLYFNPNISDTQN